MMLGHPEALVAELLGLRGEFGRVAQRGAGVAALGDWRKVEDGERDQGGDVGAGDSYLNACRIAAAACVQRSAREGGRCINFLNFGRGGQIGPAISSATISQGMGAAGKIYRCALLRRDVGSTWAAPRDMGDSQGLQQLCRMCSLRRTSTRQ